MQGLLYFGGSIKPMSSASVVMKDPLGLSQKDCNALQPHPTLIKLNGKNLNHFCEIGCLQGWPKSQVK